MGSVWFRQQSVSTLDVKLPSWVHRWPTHAQAAYLRCLAPTHSCMSLLWAVRSHQLIERFYIHFFSLLWGKYIGYRFQSLPPNLSDFFSHVPYPGQDRASQFGIIPPPPAHEPRGQRNVEPRESGARAQCTMPLEPCSLAGPQPPLMSPQTSYPLGWMVAQPIPTPGPARLSILGRMRVAKHSAQGHAEPPLTRSPAISQQICLRMRKLEAAGGGS